jgi:hypothetical protein
MLTPEKLRAMTPEDRTGLFELLAFAWWGREDYGTAAARDLDVNRTTIFRWKTSNTVPFMAIYTLDGWLEARQARKNSPGLTPRRPASSSQGNRSCSPAPQPATASQR